MAKKKKEAEGSKLKAERSKIKKGSKVKTAVKNVEDKIKGKAPVEAEEDKVLGKEWEERQEQLKKDNDERLERIRKKKEEKRKADELRMAQYNDRMLRYRRNAPCPECQAHPVVCMMRRPGYSKFRCRQCGHVWEILPEVGVR